MLLPPQATTSRQSSTAQAEGGGRDGLTTFHGVTGRGQYWPPQG
ncbi:hypothetical protein FLM9_1393 [Candidatus Synechococcus spongiarum]|uniref:Uncharacterized protein n=1 Tax=Candidatus Synechococcus spongiarum TaxID=431041 RepID=A0A161KJW8_9SYNE|nr:hypothetical protein FLM9_1393 [Candidatus Synechococcus spongiarum]